MELLIYCDFPVGLRPLTASRIALIGAVAVERAAVWYHTDVFQRATTYGLSYMSSSEYTQNNVRVIIIELFTIIICLGSNCRL